jgi:hypothetical protein
MMVYLSWKALLLLLLLLFHYDVITKLTLLVRIVFVFMQNVCVQFPTCDIVS